MIPRAFQTLAKPCLACAAALCLMTAVSSLQADQGAAAAGAAPPPAPQGGAAGGRGDGRG